MTGCEVFEEEGDLLMAHLPNGGVGLVATKDDLEKAKLEIRSHVSHQTVIAIATTSGIVAVFLVMLGYFLR